MRGPRTRGEGAFHEASLEVGQGVVDTSCTKMMVGARTMAKWLSYLEKEYGLTAWVMPANTVFRFGGGSRKRAQWAVILPAGIGGRSCALKIYCYCPI